MTICIFKNEQIQQKDQCLSGERGDLPKEYGHINKSVVRCLRYSGKYLFKSLLIQSLGTKVCISVTKPELWSTLKFFR
jgi:hypothetical protein